MRTPFLKELRLMFAAALLAMDELTPAPVLNAIDIGIIPPRQSLIKTFRLTTFDSVEDRSVQMSLRCTPSSKTQTGNRPLQRELSETITVPIFHPLSCAFVPYFQAVRQRSNASDQPLSLLDKPPSSTVCEVNLLADFALIGPKPLSIESMDLKLVRANSHIIDDTLNSELGLLPDVWQTGDTFASSWLLGLGASDTAEESAGSVLVRWRRKEDLDAPLSTTVIPLPALQPPTQEPTVYASFPTTVQLGRPIDISYSIRNTSVAQPLRLSITVESNEFWVLAGPRSIDRLTLLPLEEKTVMLKGIAHGSTGQVPLPRFRAFEQFRPQVLGEEMDEVGRADQPYEQRELVVLRESESLNKTDGAQALSILVLP